MACATDFKSIWRCLRDHYSSIAEQSIADFFLADSHRFSHFSIEACGWLCDFSKHPINKETLRLLCALAESAKLREAIDHLFSGQPINYTEGRPVLHTALRQGEALEKQIDDLSVVSMIRQAHRHMLSIAEQLYQGTWLGATKKPITDVVHIGIGGSGLGPQMVVEALAVYKGPLAPRCHFISNMDIADSLETLALLHPETTLFIIASKSFKTEETMENKSTALAWLLEGLHAYCSRTDIIERHFLAITADVEAAVSQHTIPEAHVFTLPMGVGGRYSVWSSMGLVIAISVGASHFEALLEGARTMDTHFKTAEFERNMPVILALLGVGYLDFFKLQTHAILPYIHALRRFPAYLQQLDMESNGKRIKRDGSVVDHPTGAIVWGGVGSNSQHAFHQLLFQGSHRVPIDFIVAVESQWSHQTEAAARRQLLLVSRCFSQSHALMYGKSYEEAYAQLEQEGFSSHQARLLAPHKTVPGNQPSTTLVTTRLTPQALGALMALYEHKVFVQGIIWGINSFDQWGVELGKQQAVSVASCLEQGLDFENQSSFNSSTQGLIDYFLRYVGQDKK